LILLNGNTVIRYTLTKPLSQRYASVQGQFMLGNSGDLFNQLRPG